MHGWRFSVSERFTAFGLDVGICGHLLVAWPVIVSHIRPLQCQNRIYGSNNVDNDVARGRNAEQWSITTRLGGATPRIARVGTPAFLWQVPSVPSDQILSSNIEIICTWPAPWTSCQAVPPPSASPLLSLSPSRSTGLRSASLAEPACKIQLLGVVDEQLLPGTHLFVNTALCRPQTTRELYCNLARSVDRPESYPLCIANCLIFSSHACATVSRPLGGRHGRHSQQSAAKARRVRARNWVLRSG